MPHPTMRAPLQGQEWLANREAILAAQQQDPGFAGWVRIVDRCLKENRSLENSTTRPLDEIMAAYRSGESPAVYASRVAAHRTANPLPNDQAVRDSLDRTKWLVIIFGSLFAIPCVMGVVILFLPGPKRPAEIPTPPAVTSSRPAAPVPSAPAELPPSYTYTPPPSVPNTPSYQPPTRAYEDETERTVYVTDTGDKYHSAGCRHLRRSSRPISLSDARRSYRACNHCGG